MYIKFYLFLDMAVMQCVLTRLFLAVTHPHSHDIALKSDVLPKQEISDDLPEIQS